jgi:hypothetical protein
LYQKKQRKIEEEPTKINKIKKKKLKRENKLKKKETVEKTTHKN